MEKMFYETSMFLEPFKKRKGFEDKNRGSKILANLKGLVVNISEHYKPVTSISVLGEIDLILRDSEKVNRYTRSSEEIKKEIEEILDRFEIVCISNESIHLTSELLNKDSRGLTCMDVLNFSCAISSKCNVFSFIDSELKSNKLILEIAKEKSIKLNPN